MDKNAIKKYAVWARRELISRVSQKAAFYGITDTDHGTVGAESVDGRVLTAAEKKQRDALIHQIQKDGYEQTIEEVAYTWFNRFSALRYMEVNGYLPTHVRVFTDDTGALKPQILTEAINLELDGLDMQKVYDLKNSNQDEALYRYLLITQCNALNAILPGMFQKIEDYTELLLPDNLLREGSVIEQMVTTIPEEDWTDQVQIIGWMYQYYNAEKKDDVFAALKKNVKITKENIPAATQLFTPDWIVRYMVENSLGRLWIERNAGSATDEYDERPGDQNEYLLHNWKYYVFEAKQSPEVEKELSEKRKALAGLAPEQIKCIDPCCGSGHILVYMFDVLMQIYQSYGYTPREAARSIVANNLYGLDIDERAAQLSYFAVMMKARQYDRQFLRYRDEDGNLHVFQPNVYAICESNDISRGTLKYFGWSMSDMERNLAVEQINDLLDTMQDAKEYGSIITVPDYDWGLLYRFVGTVDYSGQLDFDAGNLEETKEKLWRLLEVAATLAQKYDVVVTNPPYMGNMPAKMTEFVQKKHTIEKYDLYAVFIKRCRVFAKKNRYISMITQQAWLFLSSFEKMRKDLENCIIINLIQLGAHAFEEIGGEIVQPVCFTLKNTINLEYKGVYKNLVSGVSQNNKENLFFEIPSIVNAQSEYKKIPGEVIAYWIPQIAINLFEGKKLSDYVTIKSGIVTGNNDYFLRLWHEIEYSNIEFNNVQFVDNSNIGWVPMHKGGGYRKHYGLHDYVMNLHDIWEPSKTNASVRRGEPAFYFKEGLTWSTLSNKLSVRRSPRGFVFDTKGSMCFPLDNSNMYYLEAFLNSVVAAFYMSFLSPTLDFNQGAMGKIPLILDNLAFNSIRGTAKNNFLLSKNDWDSFETSWDFQRHPLISVVSKNPFVFDDIGNIDLAECFMCWENESNERFNQLKSNEEELNRIFIDIYGLQEELTPEVEDKDITVHKADLARDVKSLISYAVGCMFGRYSLNRPGLAYAGGDWEHVYRRNVITDENGNAITFGGIRIAVNNGYQINVDGQWQDCTYSPDTDNIIPICDDDYFEDDIVGRFVKFIETVYGKNSLETNLKFIADALGGKGQPKDVIRNYFLNDFYADHCKIYQKRPIYWLFDSGKKNGFKALIYMHRYREDTIARIRTDYVHEQQGRYRTAIADLESRIANADTGSRVKLTKQLTKLRDQAEELRVYEEKIHHLADQMIRIDLDDGVKHNYELFQDVLAKIK